MPGFTCSRCGAEEAPYSAEIPDFDIGHRTVWLCKEHARELAGIVRDYQQGRTIVCFTKHRGADE